MLDILIRDATDNRSSLDDVMLALYRDTYKAGAGFTTDQWWDAVSRAAGGRSFADFHERYIDGRERFPWREVLPLAGLTLAVDSTRAPWIGVSLGHDNEGVKIMATVPDGMAAKAGVQAGDYLLRVGEIEAGTPMARYRERYAREPEGTPIEIVVRRGTETLTLPGGLQFRTRVSHTLGEDPAATPKALRIRNGILQGLVDR
jgi:predicted metalloprotease with PDZ domain